MRLSFDSLRLQTAVIGLASVSMAALAVILIREVLSSTQETLLREAEQQCMTAVAELNQQFVDRAAFEEEPLAGLPFAAQDLSLRGLSIAVLRSYEAVEGGFVLVESSRVAGYAGPTLDEESTRSDAEVELRLLRLANALLGSEMSIERVRQGNDWLVFALSPVEGNETVAWTLKRLTEAHDPVAETRRWWIGGLVLCAVVGLGGVISISVRLRRGVDAVNTGLSRLETDFSHRIPPIQGDFGRVAEAINRMADRRAALETAVRRQERLAALGKVVAGVAHEIRNPLNSIRLSLELLHRRLKKGKAQGDEVEGSMEEVDRLARILSRLLAFGRPELEDRKPQPIQPLIDRAVKMVHEPAHRNGVEVRSEGDTEVLTADVDALQVEQVLINLLLNAVDASPRESIVSIAAESHNGAVRIAVRDKGQGIPEAVRDRVFDPYFTTKDSGNGLGLAVSREIVTQHGGSLDFETGPGGTTFILELPVKGTRE